VGGRHHRAVRVAHGEPDHLAQPNYAPVAVSVVLLYAGIFWLVSGRKMF
jgi:hypothetical protein